MGIELRHLRHLRVLAEIGSFSRAAEALHITQSALSRSIQALEALVGAPLLVRQRSGVEPTDLGAIVLGHARALDVSSRDLERDVRLALGLEIGELRVGVGPFGGAALIGPVIGQLNRRHPGLGVRVVIAPWLELPGRARAREVDVVVAALSEAETLDDIETLPLNPHRLRLVCRTGHPLAAVASPRPADVFRYPLAGPSLSAHARVRLDALRPQARRGAAFAERPLAIECDSSDLLKSILAESDAISMMPGFMIDAELASGVLADLPDVDLGLEARFGAFWLRQRPLSGAARAFVELLQRHDAALARAAEAAPGAAARGGRRGRREAGRA